MKTKTIAFQESIEVRPTNFRLQFSILYVAKLQGKADSSGNLNGDFFKCIFVK